MKPLPRKKISFLFVNETDRSSRQFAVPQTLFLIAAVAVCAAVFLTGMLAVKSLLWRTEIPATASLEKICRDHQALVAAQDRQIHLLREKLEKLSEKTSRIRSIKNEICQVGRIEPALDHENLFGVGGSRGEDAVEDNNARINTPAATSPVTVPARESNLPHHPDWLPKTINGRLTGLSDVDLLINPLTCHPALLNLKGGNVIPGAPDVDQVVSPANGFVTFVNNDSAAGYSIIIDHGYGYVTRFARVEEVTAKQGDFIRKNEVIGRLKTDSLETPLQLDFEIISNGLALNSVNFRERNDSASDIDG